MAAARGLRRPFRRADVPESLATAHLYPGRLRRRVAEPLDHARGAVRDSARLARDVEPADLPSRDQHLGVQRHAASRRAPALAPPVVVRRRDRAQPDRARVVRAVVVVHVPRGVPVLGALGCGVRRGVDLHVLERADGTSGALPAGHRRRARSTRAVVRVASPRAAGTPAWSRARIRVRGRHADCQLLRRHARHRPRDRVRWVALVGAAGEAQGVGDRGGDRPRSDRSPRGAAERALPPTPTARRVPARVRARVGGPRDQLLVGGSREQAPRSHSRDLVALRSVRSRCRKPSVSRARRDRVRHRRDRARCDGMATARVAAHALAARWC